MAIEKVIFFRKYKTYSQITPEVDVENLRTFLLDPEDDDDDHNIEHKNINRYDNLAIDHDQDFDQGSTLILMENQ